MVKNDDRLQRIMTAAGIRDWARKATNYAESSDIAPGVRFWTGSKDTRDAFGVQFRSVAHPRLDAIRKELQAVGLKPYHDTELQKDGLTRRDKIEYVLDVGTGPDSHLDRATVRLARRAIERIIEL